MRNCPDEKAPFKDRIQAMLFAATRGYVHQEAYRCPHCRRWHLRTKKRYKTPSTTKGET